MSQNNQNTTNADSQPSSAPDFIAIQYREVQSGDEWKTRKERIGAAFKNSNGSLCFRPAGQQVISNDIYLFPVEPSAE